MMCDQYTEASPRTELLSVEIREAMNALSLLTGEVVTEDFVKDAHDANLAVQVWTINTCEEMLRMMALGVDAIMTDRPLLLENLLNTPPEQRSCE